jgi:hypothetical protein
LEPLKSDESLHQLVPANVVLLVQCSRDVLVVPCRELLVGECYWDSGELEVLVDARRDANSVGVFVSANQGFHKEVDSGFTCWIPCAL